MSYRTTLGVITLESNQVWQHGKLIYETALLLISVFPEWLDSDFCCRLWWIVGGGIHPDMTSVMEGGDLENMMNTDKGGEGVKKTRKLH